MNGKTVIGLTGSFGSGCTHIYNNFLSKKGYGYVSLSTILRDLFNQETGEDGEHRQDLQDYGNKLRSENDASILAKNALDKINSLQEAKVVVDSIRNPAEVLLLKSNFVNFYLVGVFADFEVRWERVKSKYEGNLGLFEKDDKRDSDEDLSYGQRVRDCFGMADIIISNNADYHPNTIQETFMKEKIEKFVEMIEKPFTEQPSEQETIMAVAYAISQRSTCMKRKVGAVIVDKFGTVFSTGYNEVPRQQLDCQSEYGKCYRTFIRDDFEGKVSNIVEDETQKESLKKELKKSFKNLDYCRALHAEENAIINVASLGTSSGLEGATLYTTTYPCNLCANKIAQVGIKEIVYSEPYPMKEAQEILTQNDVKQAPFEGVTFKGYFRLYGGDIS